MKKLIDLSHTVENGLITYKGLPAPIICDYLSRENSKQHYADGTSFQIGKIEMCSNTGTYLDAPFHRYENGKDLSQLSLESLASLDAIRVSIPETRLAVDVDVFEGLELAGKAVLVATNWSRHWNTELYYEAHPFLTEQAALYLKEQGAALVGIDSHNIDDTTGNARPVHSTLLGADILIVEHMCNLNALPNDGFKFYALPVKMKGVGTFPVRAFAELSV